MKTSRESRIEQNGARTALFAVRPTGKRALYFTKDAADKAVRAPTSAFTLIEVMAAIALFFMATFAILDLVSQSIRMAHSLNQMGPTAGMVAAELSLTNKLEEGTFTGDWGDLYDEYTWQQDVMIWGTNGMFQVDIGVFKKGNEDSRLSIFLFRPESENHMGDGAASRKAFSGSKK